MHKEHRDSETGLYPLTLLKKHGGAAENLSCVRNENPGLVRWAQEENEKARQIPAKDFFSIKNHQF